MKYLFSPGNMAIIGLAMVGSGVYAFCEFTGVLQNPEIRRRVMRFVIPAGVAALILTGLVVWVWLTSFIERRKEWDGVVLKAYIEKGKGASSSQFVVAYQRRDGAMGVFKMDAELAALTYEKGFKTGDRIVKPRGQEFPEIVGG